MGTLANLQLTATEFSRFQKLVYDRAGIAIGDEKIALLSNRLRKRLRALELSSFEQYYRILQKCKDDAEELAHFLSAVSTNETCFFRNDRLWAYVGDTLIKRLCELNKGKKVKTARFWSAAGSSGEEAYTLAMVLREKLPDFDNWKNEIIATDISRKALNTAKTGLYKPYALQKMDDRKRRRFFHFEKGCTEFQLKDEIRKMVQFQFHNLRDSFKRSYFDVVLLRNVMMYFDTPMKKKVLDQVFAALKPGGLMITGDVDPLRASHELFEHSKLEFLSANVYQKPTAGNNSALKDSAGV